MFLIFPSSLVVTAQWEPDFEKLRIMIFLKQVIKIIHTVQVANLAHPILLPINFILKNEVNFLRSWFENVSKENDKMTSFTANA